MLSRVKTVRLVLFLSASEIAMLVALFLDKSPMKSETSAEAVRLFKRGDLSKEPDSVAGRNDNSGSGGTLDLRLSGNKMLRFLTGKVFDKYSAA